MNKEGKFQESIFADVFRDPAMNRVLFIALFIIILVIIVYVGRFWPTSISGDPSTWGAFGDYFAGIVNPILGFFTLLVVLATVYYTKQMLDTTREEMRSAQKEMALQNFDTKIFFLIKLFRDVRGELRSHRGATQGPSAFDSELHGILAEIKGNTHENASQQKASSLVRAFEARLSELPHFKTYFTAMVSILNLFDLSGHWNDEHAQLTNVYSRLIASLLTEDEAVVLFLYAHSRHVGARGSQLLLEFLRADVWPTQTGALAASLPNLNLALGGEVGV